MNEVLARLASLLIYLTDIIELKALFGFIWLYLLLQQAEINKPSQQVFLKLVRLESSPNCTC
jgi:hypothetical protein